MSTPNAQYSRVNEFEHVYMRTSILYCKYKTHPCTHKCARTHNCTNHCCTHTYFQPRTIKRTTYLRKYKCSRAHNCTRKCAHMYIFKHQKCTYTYFQTPNVHAYVFSDTSYKTAQHVHVNVTAHAHVLTHFQTLPRPRDDSSPKSTEFVHAKAHT